MIEFIKQIEDDDNWYFKPVSKLDFSILKTIDYCSFFNKKTTLSLRIEALEETNAPSNKQLETLDFILENQEKILHAIFNFNQQSIYPIFNASIDIEEDEIVHTPSQLSRVYGIKHIEIPHFKTLKFSYFLIRFDFRYDDEHGLYFFFKDTTVIDFFGEGDKNFDAMSVYKNN